MILNLNDPTSIAAWRSVWPERHDEILRSLWKRFPQFRAAIEASRGLL